MANKRNCNIAKSGYSPPTPVPAKKKIDRFSSPSGSICLQEDYYLITSINCNQTFVYTLTNDHANTNTNEQGSSDLDIVMNNQDQQIKKHMQKQLHQKNKNRSTDRPDVPLFSSIIPHNESLPHTFPNNK
nr:16068_t:CDS:1 [Entrophospora candida]CAG8489595.1 9428_t:CDS:1 [Entrophospora candida]